jgi:hypothetical protein
MWNRAWLSKGWNIVLVATRIATYSLTVIGGIVGLKEYTDTHENERREAAQQAYDRVDANFNEFIKLCVTHPDLDCYPGSELLAPAPRLEIDPLKLIQHRALYMVLIDTFKVAYINYNTEHYAAANPAGYCAQWPGWISELKLYTRRAEFRSTWNDVGDKFDSHFARCLNAILAEQDTGATPRTDSAPPAACMSPKIRCEHRG